MLRSNDKEPHALALDMRRDFVAFERNAFVACQGLKHAALLFRNRSVSAKKGLMWTLIR